MSPKVLIFLTPIEQELERGEAVQRAKQRVLSSPISYTTKGRPRLEEHPDCALSPLPSASLPPIAESSCLNPSIPNTYQ